MCVCVLMVCRDDDDDDDDDDDNDNDVDRAKDNLLQPLWSWSITTFPEAASHYIFGSILACTTFFISCIYFSYTDLASKRHKKHPRCVRLCMRACLECVRWLCVRLRVLVYVAGSLFLVGSWSFSLFLFHA